MGRMVLMSLNILCTPEDTVVETEHIEGRHGGDACHDPTHHRTDGGDACHDPTHHRTVLETGGNDLILRAEA